MRDKEGKNHYCQRNTADHEKNQRKNFKSSKNDGYYKQKLNKEIERNFNEENSNDKFINSKKSSSKRTISRSGGEEDIVTKHGSLRQYCVKDSQVLLRDVHYLKNERSKMLMITVDDKQHQTDTYTILSTKDVCPYTFMDRNAFVLKVIDINKKLKSMTFQTSTEEEKKIWINNHSLNMGNASDLLQTCIKEIERRRFQLGIKKRSEEKSKVKVEADSLSDLLNIVTEKKEILLQNDVKWTVGNLERLIQLILNELLQPLINFNLQKNIRKSENNELNPEVEARFIINNLSPINRIMLTFLLNHMERLSKYYLIIMSSPKKILPQIRRNICRRLSPIIFRIQHDLENEMISSRCSDILYNIMIIINDTTD